MIRLDTDGRLICKRYWNLTWDISDCFSIVEEKLECFEFRSEIERKFVLLEGL